MEDNAGLLLARAKARPELMQRKVYLSEISSTKHEDHV